MLRCPNCHAELKREGKAFRCRNGHSFDVARQGYVNLLVNARRETGDNKEMVSADRLSRTGPLPLPARRAV